MAECKNCGEMIRIARDDTSLWVHVDTDSPLCQLPKFSKAEPEARND
jgi:hypothetical protein